MVNRASSRVLVPGDAQPSAARSVPPDRPECNPKSGVKLEIPPSRPPKFRTSKSVKGQVRGGPSTTVTCSVADTASAFAVALNRS